MEEAMRSVEALQARASVQAAFGEPRTVGDRTIIPVARVSYGYGAGWGRGWRPSEREGQAEEAVGQGAGGGGAVRVQPMGVVEITPQRTSVIPILNVTWMAIAGMLLAAWNVFWITYTIRAVRRRKG